MQPFFWGVRNFSAATVVLSRDILSSWPGITATARCPAFTIFMEPKIMSCRCLCLALLLAVTIPIAARAEDPILADTATPRPTLKPSSLPLKRVVIFSSGVAFFEHAGQVTDDAKIDMQFKANDVNDLLKSMVVQDLDGGQVSTVTYASKDPITKTLKGFAVDLTTNPTMAQLLQQLRGERVVVEAPNELSGVILGVETRKVKLNDRETVETSVLNLLTDQGLRAVSLDTVGRLKLANEKLDAELRKALAVLASSHATDKKSVELTFLGKGTRRVRVGYIQAAPVWKTTYRLVLANDQKPLLQGWAIVENTSEEDWSNVNLTLVSGRPISFTMDLYQPLYVPRPDVALELYSSLRPQVHGADVSGRHLYFSMSNAPAAGLSLARTAENAGYGKPAETAAGTLVLGEGLVVAHNSLDYSPEGDGAAKWKAGIQAAAKAGNVGNLFKYTIATPVSLPRQQSAMLPIANAEIKCDKLAIYNAAVQTKHPLYGLRFTNTTDLYLMQGPITVFDGGVYAGDAKIEDVPPGAQRLLSYGLDLETEVAPQIKNQPEEFLSVRLLKGVMLTDRKFVRSQQYTVKNSGKQAKTVLIEYPIDAAWKLVSPEKPTEKTRDLYRFAVEAKPGEPAKLVVDEQRTERQEIALNNLDDNAIRFYQSVKVVSDRVKSALAEIVKRKSDMQQLVAERQQHEQRIQRIAQDQKRIGQNMDRLDRTSELYKRYVKTLTDQEEEVAKLTEKVASLTEQETLQRKSLDEYLMSLDLQ
jgi:hypothetical protein